MARRYCYWSVMPFAAMVTNECINAGLNTLFKAATLEGLNNHVFVAYAYGVAALLLLPASFFSRRSRVLPPMSFSIMWKIGALGSLGALSQILGSEGINYSSAALASAISNLTPAFTFILAIIFGMEKLDMRKASSVAKVIGTIVSISGAFVVTFYKGPTIIKVKSIFPSLHQSLGSSESNWIIGAFCLTAQYILIPLWSIVQAQTMKEYPDEVTVIFLYNTCVSMFAAFVALLTEGTSTAWKIGLGIPLASVLCSGVIGSGLSIVIFTWALKVRGPVYVAMFKPLSIVIAVTMGVIFLHDILYLGSVIGAIIISVGFHTVLWGKAKEVIVEDHEVCNLQESQSNNKHKAPLLQSYNVEEGQNSHV